MSTSNILLDQNSSANEIDIMVVEFPAWGGGIEHMVRELFDEHQWCPWLHAGIGNNVMH